MEVTLEQLRMTYSNKDTDELLELRARNQLTDIARTAIDEELKLRGVSQDSVVIVQEKQKIETEKTERLLSTLAPVYLRAIAVFIDIPGGVLLLIMVSEILTTYTPKSFHEPLEYAFLPLWVLYALFKDSFGGQSIGKRVVGIRVVNNATEKPCSYMKSFIRNIVLIFGIFDQAFLFTKEKRRLGDVIANTRVVLA